MLFDEKTIVNYLTERKIEGKKELTEERLKEKFVKQFNKEARKQNSDWVAEIDHCKSLYEGKPFTLIYLRKRIIKKGFLFTKYYKKISLHVGCGNGFCSFVDNDYVISDGDEERNKKVLSYLPELEPILKKIKVPFSILKNYQFRHFLNRVDNLNRRINSLEARV